MPIESNHPQYDEYLPIWQKIDDFTRNKDVRKYLRILNRKDTSEENKIRNEEYRKGAVFYGISGQTVSGLLGILFKKAPALTVPPGLEYVNDDIDGQGNSVFQQAQGLADDVIRKSRAGLYVSFPSVDGQISQADLNSGRFRAVSSRIEPERIVNWRADSSKLTLIVIAEMIADPANTDPFTHDMIEQRRELFIDDSGFYAERHWQKIKDVWVLAVEAFNPVDSDGNRFDVIPFTFIGAENNDTSIDAPVMRGLVELNKGHFQNSADFEDNAWFAGQSQPWMSGLDRSHFDFMKDAKMYVGSRNVLAVPSGGSFGISSAPPNPLIRQAMLDKEQLMVSLGARIIQGGVANKTAEQVMGEREVQHSVLSLIGQNITDAYSLALQWIGRYMGVQDDVMQFVVNTDFINRQFDSAELQQIMAGMLQGTMPMTDYVRYMRSRGLFTQEKTDEEYVEILTETAQPQMPQF